MIQIVGQIKQKNKWILKGKKMAYFGWVLKNFDEFSNDCDEFWWVLLSFAEFWWALEDIVMGDITKVVARELNLSDLLD
jgi:hypothetical protein